MKKKAAKKSTTKTTSAKSKSKKKAKQTAAKSNDAAKSKEAAPAEPGDAASNEEDSASAVVTQDGVNWLLSDKDYRVALVDGKLACQNAKGKQLASVPKWLKESDVAQELLQLRDWLAEHAEQCRATIEMWMLRSLPVPLKVLASVWPDPAWRNALENLVVCPVTTAGELDQDQAGFLRGAENKEGLGIVDLDGETQWISSQYAALPHPILLEELGDFRELIAELQFEQQTDQLFRQTWEVPEELPHDDRVDTYHDGRFEQLNFALGHCRRLGFRVRGGYACCRVWEGGRLLEARYWIGADYPENETYTGDLCWVDEREATLKIQEIGPVAYSEGIRMAEAITRNGKSKSKKTDSIAGRSRQHLERRALGPLCDVRALSS